MPDTPKTFYLTTPIYYVNARPHIGHAYTTIVADVLARRHRLLGEDTFFLTGTDEHGQKIERSAAAAGIPPQQFADQVSKSFEDLWHRMGITHDHYIRTTDPRHQKGVQKLFATLYEKGFIYLDSYTGAYCVSDETFVDVTAGEPCPDCGRITESVTEENFFFKLSAFQLPLLNLIESNQLKIENDARRNEVLSFLRGNTTTPSTTVISTEAQRSGEIPALSPAAAPTLAHTAAGTPYVPGALKDLSVSRSSFTWGIPVPEPAASQAKQKHVIYVWLDALANYMTAIGYGSDAPVDEEQFKKFWPADLHLVGKEIIRFHCVYWPAFLLAAELPLPKAITAHGWLLFDNSKMSKSKGNIVRTETILDAFGTLCPPTFDAASLTGETLTAQGASLTGGGSGLQPTEKAPPEKGALAPGFREPTKAERDLFASDVLRYFLLREIPFGQDGSFSFDALITRYNADLANGYGNLVSRTLSMIRKYCDGLIPGPVVKLPGNLFWELGKSDTQRTPLEQSLAVTVALSITAAASLDRLDFALSLGLCQDITASVDQMLTSTAPWKIDQSTEDGKAKIAETLYAAAESIRYITALLYPILPATTAKVWLQLGLGDIEQAAKNGNLKDLHWGGLKPGTKLGPLAPIFPRADKGLAQIMSDMENPTPSAPEPTDSTHPAAPPRSGASDAEATLSVAGSTATTTRTGPTPSHTEAQPSGIFANQPAAPAEPTPADTSPTIAIDDFIKIDLRVAEIKIAERIPKADKLLRLEVDLGALGTRQILSGIAEWYAPEDLIGRRIIVIANLAPRKMRGLESHGMLLAASEEGGKPFLATVPEGVPTGTRLK